ncbi:MAG: TIGR00725 family protein [Methanomicrobiales archaeon]|nr:TIGR00725 family protein [Methanomicrobiales archaeon]NYT21036.1 TIGR00725 family protein [Methanomicrobiales archaeon]
MNRNAGEPAHDRPVQVAVIGPGTCTPDEYDAGYCSGRILALNHAILLCGGLGGVMEAACRGAREGNGIAVGILPDAAGGNPYLSVIIRSDLGNARNAVIVQSADAVIAIGGAYGTLSEIALALKTGKKVFGVRTWDIPGVTPCAGPEEAAVRALAAARRSPA